MKNAHFIRYRIVGYNRNYLLNLLRRQGITLHKIAIKEKNVTELSIEFNEKQKFFAITENLCYNISRVKEHGFLYPLSKFSKRIGLAIGVAVFIVAAILADRVVFAIDYTGTGALYKNQAAALLKDYGVQKFAFVTTEDLKNAERGALSSSDTFSFVSIKKRGGRLKINLVASTVSDDILDTSRKNLISTADGVVESVKVYKGTAAVAVGDSVCVGDELIQGYDVIKDVRVETYALGVVTILTQKTVTLRGDEDEEKLILTLARQAVDGDVVKEDCVYSDGTYAVTFTCRIKIK